MKLIDRYLLREYLAVLAYCLVAFVSIVVIFDLFEHLTVFLDRRPSWREIAVYYGYVVAPSFEYMAPTSLLLGTLYTLWQFTRHNEITAMRAGGIGLWRIVTPFLCVGLAFSILTAVVKETVTPRASRWIAEFLEGPDDMSSVMKDLAHYNTLGRRLWLIGGIDLDRPEQLKTVKVTQERPDGTRQSEIQAGRAEWLDGQWWLFSPVERRYNEADDPMGPAAPLGPTIDSAVQLDFFDERPSDFADEVIDWDFLSSRAIWRYLKRHPNISPQDKAHRELLLHQRMAMPWACLVITLMAIPAGLRGGRRGVLGGVILTVALFFAFYACMQVGRYLAMRQTISPWLGAWLSNIVFTLSGGMLAIRIR